ncbi:hypothetical protein ACFQZE_07210 [Paenibacillus sp. GCM10027627]|uniref:hypothetical protein n=1 Tax=unclassified Paenibacillus TaxID=185978 RepID=UPI00362896B6
MNKFINLTPHAIKLYEGDNIILEVPVTKDESGNIQTARVSQTYEQQPSIANYPVFKSTYGVVEGLLEPQPDTYFVVSLLVAQALQLQNIKRDDILVPDTGAGAKRNDTGQIIGTTRFMII